MFINFGHLEKGGEGGRGHLPLMPPGSSNEHDVTFAFVAPEIALDRGPQSTSVLNRLLYCLLLMISYPLICKVLRRMLKHAFNYLVTAFTFVF